MRLFLCEKPSQARDIAAVLGATRRSEGHLAGNGVTVTWCFGHLLEMCPPDAYDEAYKRWDPALLPIVPERWRLAPRAKAAGQLSVIGRLLRKTDEVVIATDADREGETIGREVLDHHRWRGPVSRLWLSALDESSIRRALAGLRPGASTESLYRAGLVRARADWLVGMNATRLFTCLARAGQDGKGSGGVLSIGRVQTPTLRIIVDRDRLIEAFMPVPFFDVVMTLSADRAFQARWRPALGTQAGACDTEGRCLRRDAAVAVAESVRGNTVASVRSVETRQHREAPPLPYDLSSLQQECSQRFGMAAKRTLEIAQSLYETHKATTYPRTDCRYLPESMLGETDAVLDALAAGDTELAPLVAGVDRRIRARAWNDAKITAHHAIIPTAAACDRSRMDAEERLVHDLIRRRYLAQFHGPHVYEATTVLLTCVGETFEARGRRTLDIGWKAVEPKSDAPARTGEAEADQSLPTMETGQRLGVADVVVQDRKTKPPARYTEGTLIGDMKSAAKFVTDQRLKQRLKDTAGIGTEATRAGIIETLVQRGYIERKAGKLISTPLGRSLIDAVPDAVKDPGMTALWEQALEGIVEGAVDADAFMRKQAEWVTGLCGHYRGAALALPGGRNKPPSGRATKRRTARRKGYTAD